MRDHGRNLVVYPTGVLMRIVASYFSSSSFLTASASAGADPGKDEVVRERRVGGKCFRHRVCPLTWPSPFFLGAATLKAEVSTQFVKQSSGVFQISSVEAFSEPTVNLCEDRSCFCALAVLQPQAREAYYRAQLK